jgi:hypothetical protein
MQVSSGDFMKKMSLIILGLTMFSQATWATGKTAFGSTGSSSYLCDVKSSTGVIDRLGVSASYDERARANGEKLIIPRLQFKTLHKRTLPIQDLDLSPFDEIVLASMKPEQRKFAMGYYLNQFAGAAVAVATFPEAPPTLLDFGKGPLPIKFSEARSATVEFAAVSSPAGAIAIHVKDQGLLVSGNGVNSNFSIEFSGTCVRQADNTRFGF